MAYAASSYCYDFAAWPVSAILTLRARRRDSGRFFLALDIIRRRCFTARHGQPPGHFLSAEAVIRWAQRRRFISDMVTMA